MPILEEDYVHQQVYFLQALVHFIDLLEWPGVHFFFFHHLRRIGLHPLLPSSLELPLITIFFNIFACLLARALYIVKKVKLLV